MKKQTILMLAAFDLFALKINEKPIKSVHQALKMHTTMYKIKRTGATTGPLKSSSGVLAPQSRPWRNSKNGSRCLRLSWR